jgi:septal ring factor EnvC (AmiA/AmiB activator)
MDSKKSLEREIAELRDTLNRTTESKNVLEDQLHQAHTEKDDVMKKLKEVEIYQQLNQ